MGMVTMADLKPNISGKRTSRPFISTANSRHVSEWPISDVSSDLTVEVGPSCFALHKFPLVSRSGTIRKLLLESKDSSKLTRITLHSVPGGPEAFELAAKFCYGVHVEITLSNVAMLRCAAHFLEMSEDYADKNLEARTEAYLKDVVFSNISNSISVLHRCEPLMPTSDDVGLVNRLVNSVACHAGNHELSTELLRLEQKGPRPGPHPDPPASWWGRALTILSLDFFYKVLSAVRLKGLKQESICTILIHYAQSSLHLAKGNSYLGSIKLQDSELQKKQSMIVETMVNLLPPHQSSRKRTAGPIGFLSSLLKTAIVCSASTSCRAELEKRVGLQLDQAILEDILIPVHGSCGHGGHSSSSSPMYDIDSVLRIFAVFLNLDNDDDDDDDDGGDEGDTLFEFDSPPGSPKQSAILKVSKLLDSYIAEVALDSNLTPSKFIALAELLPDHARVVTDGLYRAVDIFLKVHPNIKDSERYRLCKTIDCQKLSQEACSHAAQNERLPVQMAVQVLYFEQMRLRNAMSGSHNHQFFFGSLIPPGAHHFPQRSGSGAGSGAISPRDNYASVRRENRELKLEVARMRMRLTDLEKDHVSMKQELVRSHPANKLFKSFTKKLRKLNDLFRLNTIKTPPKPLGGASRANSESRFFFQKRRRHSVG